MDERAHPRYPAGVEAIVEHRWLGNLNGRIRDVNANGIYVELPPRANLNPVGGRLARTPITVHYRLPAGPAGRPCVWRGYVARIGDSGVGASISDPPAGGDPHLLRLVEYARRTEQRRRDVESPSNARSG